MSYIYFYPKEQEKTWPTKQRCIKQVSAVPETLDDHILLQNTQLCQRLVCLIKMHIWNVLSPACQLKAPNHTAVHSAESRGGFVTV